MSTLGAVHIAQHFHNTYELLAPQHGYETREASAKPWDEVPENNRNLMCAVVQDLLDRNIIKIGPAPQTAEELEARRSSFSRQNMQGRIDEVAQQVDDQARERSGQKEA